MEKAPKLLPRVRPGLGIRPRPRPSDLCTWSLGVCSTMGVKASRLSSKGVIRLGVDGLLA